MLLCFDFATPAEVVFYPSWVINIKNA